MKKLTCHCGEVEIEVSLSNDLKNLIRCNCSFCKRHSSVMAIIESSNLKIVKGQELIKSYQFHTKTAEHYFCSVCGIYTHHKPRTNPNMRTINVACLENVNPFDLKDISTKDGANHPLDKKK